MIPRELWERFRTLRFDDPHLGLSLDASRTPLDEEALQEREPAMQEALGAMAALEAGATANPDENRMVGHYWLRAPEKAPTADTPVSDCATFLSSRCAPFAKTSSSRFSAV